MWTLTLFTTYEIKCLISKVKTKLHQHFTDEWQTEMLKLSKLCTYHQFKSTFETEKYLYIFNKNHRQALTRFCQRSHNLEVEKGRWRRKLIDGKWHNYKIPVEKRLCIFCPSGQVEPESHVLMLCNRYSDLRSNLFHVAKPLIANFHNLVAF